MTIHSEIEEMIINGAISTEIRRQGERTLYIKLAQKGELVHCYWTTQTDEHGFMDLEKCERQKGASLEDLYDKMSKDHQIDLGKLDPEQWVAEDAEDWELGDCPF